VDSDSGTKTEGMFPKVRLARQGSVLVVSIPGAPKVSVEEANEWIRKSRDGEIQREAFTRVWR
jgi:hypothetical protein